jgi:hypothetical protein
MLDFGCLGLAQMEPCAQRIPRSDSLLHQDDLEATGHTDSIT